MVGNVWHATGSGDYVRNEGVTVAAELLTNLLTERVETAGNQRHGPHESGESYAHQPGSSDGLDATPSAHNLAIRLGGSQPDGRLLRRVVAIGEMSLDPFESLHDVAEKGTDLVDLVEVLVEAL